LLVDLPNGLKVHAPSEMEARLIYHEIFETETYGKPTFAPTSKTQSPSFTVKTVLASDLTLLSRRLRALSASGQMSASRRPSAAS
jgi:hypothetical protein